MARCQQRCPGCGCRGTARSAAVEPTETEAAAAAEMTVHRYIHNIPIRDCDCVSQMEELCQIMDRQNRILAEILEAIRGCGGYGT